MIIKVENDLLGKYNICIPTPPRNSKYLLEQHLLQEKNETKQETRVGSMNLYDATFVHMNLFSFLYFIDILFQ